MIPYLALLRSIRALVKKDSTLERKEIVALALEAQPLLAGLYAILGRSIFQGVAIFLFFLRAIFLWWGKTPDEHGVLILPGTANELRAARDLMGRNQRTPPSLTAALWDLCFCVWISLLHGRQLSRIVNHFSKGQPLFIRMRLVELLVVYLIKGRGETKGVKTIVVTSEGNPHGLALLALGARFRIKTKFISHAPISVNPVAIRCDQAILCGEESLNSLLRAGSEISSVEFSSRPREIFLRKAKDQFHLSEICICLGMGFQKIAVEQVVEFLNLQLPEVRMKVRAHPNLPVATKILDSKISVSRGRSFQEDFSAGTLALAGNSTVHLDLWVRGIPSLYWPDLDRGADCLLPFLRDQGFPRLEGLEDLKNANGRSWDSLSGSHMHGILFRYYSGERRDKSEPVHVDKGSI